MITQLRKARKTWVIVFFIFCALYIPALTAQSDDIPTIVDPVTDMTNTLSRGEYYELRRQIIQFEDSTSNQIVILMVPSLQGNEIRDYGIRVLEKNKIGQKGKDNGVLILVAKDDRKVSIEVGYGLEGVLTDALCDQIIRNEIRPRFREGDYVGGLSAAITAIMQVTRGEYTAEKKNNNDDWIGVLFILGVILFATLASFRRRHYSISSHGYRRHNDWWWGGGFGGGGGFGSFGGGGGGWSAGGGSFGGGGASGSW